MGKSFMSGMETISADAFQKVCLITPGQDQPHIPIYSFLNFAHGEIKGKYCEASPAL